MGSKVGRQKGDKVVSKKQKRAKRIIRKYYKIFDTGFLNARQTYTLANITKTTFYRYLKDMRDEDAKKGIIWSDEMLDIEDDKKKNTQISEIQELIRAHKELEES